MPEKEKQMNNIELREDVPLPFPAEVFKKQLATVLDYLKIDNWELSVVITDAETIRILNRDFRNTDAPTDVLSFPQEGDVQPDGFYYAGDLVFCPEQIAGNCRCFGEEEKTEWLRLAVHGILHLSGYSHNSYEADDPMLKYQEEIIQELKKSV